MKNEETNSDSALDNIRWNLSKLTAKEKKAASYLLRKPKEVSNSVISEYASASAVSEGTIVRLAKKLGYKGNSELKRELIVQLVEEKEDFTHSEVGPSDKFDEILSKVIDSSIQALTDTEKFIAKESGEKAVEILSSASVSSFTV